MLASYYFKQAQEIMAEVRSSPRSTPEVLLAARMEKVVKSMLEKTQGRGGVEAPKTKIRCGVVGDGNSEIASTVIQLIRANYKPVSVWMTANVEHEVIYDAESEPLPVTATYETTLPYYVSSNDPAWRKAFHKRMGSSMLFGNAAFDPSVVRASDTYSQPGTTVGAFCFLGHFVHLGSLVHVGSHVSFSGDVSVEDFCVIDSHVTILSGARIGAGCHIGAGSIIGAGAIVNPGTIVPPGSYFEIN